VRELGDPGDAAGGALQGAIGGRSMTIDLSPPPEAPEAQHEQCHHPGPRLHRAVAFIPIDFGGTLTPILGGQSSA
jgi:hypothetical protein